MSCLWTCSTQTRSEPRTRHLCQRYHYTEDMVEKRQTQVEFGPKKEARQHTPLRYSILVLLPTTSCSIHEHLRLFISEKTLDPHQHFVWLNDQDELFNIAFTKIIKSAVLIPEIHAYVPNK